jgi:mRNA-degrading endonuclease RelE of RelBE toxin-antitoxin system
VYVSLCVVIVETKAFTARVGDLLSEEEYRALQLELLARPDSGSVIPGTGGLRKLRWALSGRGKRGGARVIYFWHRASGRVLMLFVYPKNERSDLTAAQRQALRQIVETEYP